MALTNVCTSHPWLLYKPGIAREPVALDQLGPSLSLSPSPSRRSNNEIEKEKIMAKVVWYSTIIPSTDIRNPTHATMFRRSIIIRMGRPRRRRKRSISSRATLLGSVSGELGLRKYLEFQGHSCRDLR